jgi:methionyl-tRNA formyltransferase
MNRNNYVFFGSPEFAAEVLKKLIEEGAPPKLVITNPDRPQGRNLELTPPPAKLIAKRNNIPFIQPENLNLEEIRSSGTDFGLVAAYSKILKREVLDSFPKGILGLHPSLLPKYRGASPIQSALLAGETETGISLYLMDEKVDHGSILGEKKVSIEDSDDYFSLEENLAEAGAKLFAETAPKFLAGELNLLPQNEALATFTKKFTTEDAFLKPEDVLAAKNGDTILAPKIFNTIRAFVKEPGAWTYGSALPELQTPATKRVKLLSSKIEGGKLKILKVQIEGKLPKNL